MKTFIDLGGKLFFISKELPPPASGTIISMESAPRMT